NSRASPVKNSAHSRVRQHRELRAVLTEAMVLKPDGWLEAEDLTIDDQTEAVSTAATPHTSTQTTAHRPGAPDHREVALTLAATHGAVTSRQLAAACGISPEGARRAL